MDKWIPVREKFPEDREWVQVQTQDGTVFPAKYENNQWVPIFRGGLVEHLMHGKVAYWQPHDVGYPYVQCKCGNFYLQAEGRKSCPVCAAFGLKEEKPKKEPKKKKEEEIPFSEPPTQNDDFDDLLI